MRPTFSSLLSLLLGVLTLSLAPIRAQAAAQDSPLERIETELESAPDDVDLLDKAARAAKEAGDSDTALWYAKLARDAALGNKKLKKKLKAIDELILSLGAPVSEADSLLDAYAKEVFALARTCERRKLYANAVDLLVRCRGTRFEPEARKKLEKLYSNKKAVEALLASGIEIPEKPATKKSPAWILKEDTKHLDWEDAYEVEGKSYTIITNIGYEMAHVIHDAMDQMNVKLREVFKHKQRGGGMRRTVIKIYKTREEFDVTEEIDNPGVQGFFSPGQFLIVTFDPRDRGGSLTGLWDTLFHEATHQFKHAVTTNLLPGWGNEGMACYFEGARLLPSGFVETNLVPSSRLKSLRVLLENGSPTLKETVSFFQPGSYGGEFYPMGWGLMYYILNYENEKSERVYLEPYSEWWQTYTGGKKHDVFARWEEYFIEQAEVPGITNFAEFEEHWKEWIEKLASIENGGPEQADVLIARARKQLENGKQEYALESFTWALRKRPGDPVALREISDLQLELGSTDAGIFNLRRLLNMSRGRVDGETLVGGMDQSWDALAEDVVGVMTGVDKYVGEGAASAGETFVASILKASDTFTEAEFPRNALYLLENANAVLGGDSRIETQIREIEESEEIGLARWRRLAVPTDLAGWQTSKDYSAKVRGQLEVNTSGMASATTKAEMPAKYRYEVWIEPGAEEDNSVYGLAFGSNNQTGLRIFAYIPDRNFAGVYALKGSPEKLHDLKKPKLEDKDVLRFAIEVEGSEVRFLLNDTELGKETLRPDFVRGGVGVFVQNSSATISEMRTRY